MINPVPLHVFFSLVILSLTHSVVASWTLVNDFEQSSGETVPDYLIGDASQPDGSVTPVLMIGNDSEDSNNRVLTMTWDYETQPDQAISWAEVPIPAIETGGKGTVYFRVMFDIDYHFEAGVSDLETLGSLSDQNVRLQFPDWRALGGNEEIKGFRIYTDKWNMTEPVLTPESFKWHEFWIVILNGSEASDKAYCIYHRGPDEEVPQLLWFDAEDLKWKLPMAGVSESAIKRLILSWQMGMPLSGPSTFRYVDDIYVDSEQVNLGDPRIDEQRIIQPGDEIGWCGYHVSNGWINTGDVSGMLYVSHAPWLWSFDLKAWIYTDDCFSQQGGWIYVPAE